MRMRAWVLWLVLLLSISALQAKKQPWVDGGRVHFELSDLDGHPVRSDDARFDGKVVLLDLWGTWCPPCLTEIPTFVELQKRYGDDGLVVVGIAFERQEDAAARRQHLRAAMEKNGIDYLVLDGGTIADFETAVPDLRDVTGFPVEVLIGRDGKVAAARNGFGYRKRWARRLDDEVRGLLGLPPGQ